ncbi:MAG: ArnT family glycosyltransferase [Anaerolineae bacterium]
MAASTEGCKKSIENPPPAEVVVSLGLFVLALIPRALALQRFVTADEAKWVYRSAQFLAAFLGGDWAGTSVNLTPAVTTTWLGSLGLAAYYALHQADLGSSLSSWLASLPPFRVDLEVLAATRWPVVLLTSGSVVVTYRLARRLFGPTIALIGAIFIALDPHALGLSRVLGHDAPVTVFTTWALLALLIAVGREPGWHSPVREPSLRWWAASGACAGLAFLSKAPALFLIPFALLLALVDAWRHQSPLRPRLQHLALWGAAAWLVFVAIWPAAWVDPVGRPLAVANNAFLSATDEDEAAEETFWEVPDLGPGYYLVHGAFKLSPLVLVGLALFIFVDRKFGERKSSSQSPNLLSLIVFALLFAAFISLSDKRSPRYILPAFPALALVAAAGWSRLAKQPRPRAVIWLILALSLATALPYAPYYFTYFNPLLGGPMTAPRLVKLGWGEGLDQVGRWLDARPSAGTSRAGSYYASALAPFYRGDLSDPTATGLDYVVLYRKQRQGGAPSPAFVRYYEAQGALHTVRLNGIDYAQVFAGPALQPALAAQPAFGPGILPKPLGYRPLTPYLPIGEAATVEVLWLAGEPLPSGPSTVSLRPAEALTAPPPPAEPDEHGHNDEGEAGAEIEAGALVVFAAGQGRLQQLAEGVVVSRHQLQLPADLGRGTYSLWVDGRPLGEAEARWLSPPPLAETVEVDFGQLKLRGYTLPGNDSFSPGQTLDIELAWQASEEPRQDLTAFAHLLNEAGERVTGFDRRLVVDGLPSSAWQPGEFILDRHPLPLPADLPPGPYELVVGLYADAAQGPLGIIDKRGAKINVAGDGVRLGTITVAR